MSWLNRILYLLNMLMLFALALCYLSPHISPSTFLWPIAFLGLLYPIILAINLVFTLYWIVSFKRYFWSNFFIILIGWGHLSTLINIESEESDNKAAFTVMSYNVRLFNVYEWIDNKNVKNEIVNFINNTQPNILCLQEFYAPNELPNIQLPYQHIGLQSQKKQWRMATYSSFPIINKGTVSIKGERKNTWSITVMSLAQNDAALAHIPTALSQMGTASAHMNAAFAQMVASLALKDASLAQRCAALAHMDAPSLTLAQLRRSWKQP